LKENDALCIEERVADVIIESGLLIKNLFNLVAFIGGSIQKVRRNHLL
jgi:hypothetical protein